MIVHCLLAAICADEAITKAMPVAARTGFTSATARNSRRLQTTTSEAGVAHEVSIQCSTAQVESNSHKLARAMGRKVAEVWI